MLLYSIQHQWFFTIQNVILHLYFTYDDWRAMFVARGFLILVTEAIRIFKLYLKNRDEKIRTIPKDRCKRDTKIGLVGVLVAGMACASNVNSFINGHKFNICLTLIFSGTCSRFSQEFLNSKCVPDQELMYKFEKFIFLSLSLIILGCIYYFEKSKEMNLFGCFWFLLAMVILTDISNVFNNHVNWIIEQHSEHVREYDSMELLEMGDSTKNGRKKLSDITECEICNLDYSTQNLPCILKECGHTVCQECAWNLLKPDFENLRCPTCRDVTFVPNGNIGSLPINEQVFKLVKNKENPEVSECPLCQNPFTTDFKIPRVLKQCGHTLCEQCIDGFLAHKLVHLTLCCPLCNLETLVPEGSARNLPKNFTLFALLEEMELQINTRIASNS